MNGKKSLNVNKTCEESSWCDSSFFAENKRGEARGEEKKRTWKETAEGGGKEEATRGGEAQTKRGGEAEEIVW